MILETIKTKIQEFKFIIFTILVISFISYIGYLKYQLVSKNNEILKLQTTLEAQNNAIESAYKEREQLQASLKTTADTNKLLESTVNRFKAEINRRSTAKTCEEAMTNILNTANTIAKNWNEK